MPDFVIRCQTTGSKRWLCKCGKVNYHRVWAGSYLLKCRVCERLFVIGDAFFEITHEGDTASAPSDLAIPRGSDEPSIPEPALPSGEDESFRRAIRAGKWYSGDPVTLELPKLTSDKSALYRETETGKVWVAIKVAHGTRVIAQPLESMLNERRDDVEIRSRRQWDRKFEWMTGGVGQQRKYEPKSGPKRRKQGT